MSSDYQKMMKSILSAKCSTCHGSGSCNDAEPGDMSFNEWTCTDCKGTGIKIQEKHITVYQKYPEKNSRE